jgi:ribonucleoside-diphosphate reductase alpha chain
MKVRTKLNQVRKRDGRIVEFESQKIANAIRKAFAAVRAPNGKTAGQLADEIVSKLEEKYAGQVPEVEDIQDFVEEHLVRKGYSKVAKAYILYRQRRAEIRGAKKFFGVEDELKLPINTIRVLERRYLQRDDQGRIAETPSQMFRRVAQAVALAELNYDQKADVDTTAKEFYRLMSSLQFMPNSPTLMNAGTSLGQLSACFVLPVGDSLTSIFDAVKYMALIHQSGGGTGFSFSHIRPKGDMVRSTHGIASGPVSFIRVFDTSTDVIKQGGRRRGANMAILRVDHPDILEFITAKSREAFLLNFNLSVAATDEFMQKVETDEEYYLINPRTKQPVKSVRARDVFDLIVTMAWQTGDPGLIFIDEINRYNPTQQVGEIESTNPCGEQPLLPYESCNLGSINLSKMIENGAFAWEKFRNATRISVRFLDDVIEVSKFPLLEIEQITKGNRKIGLGVMGLADALVQLGIPYNSEEAIDLADKIMKFLEAESHKASAELAQTRGPFPNFKGSMYDRPGQAPLRNSTATTIAPTGTISIIAGCSSGIEPLFAISFVRSVMEGTQLLEVNPLFERLARERGFYSTELMMEIAKTGSVRDIPEVPDDVKRIFITAFDVAPEWHVRMQAAFQKYTDNSVSKTINFAHDATVEDVRKAYLLAYKLKCKGITVYRYGSKREQVLYIGAVMGKETGEQLEYVSADSEYAGGCPYPFCPY